MIPTVNVTEKNERYYKFSCVMLRHYTESKLFSISEAKNRSSVTPCQADCAPALHLRAHKQIQFTQRCVLFLGGRRWTHFKSIVILSEEHDR
jgi:hypothetical protein